jgi:hypothetical protein
MRKNYSLLLLSIVFTVNAMAQNIPSYVPKDGLVGYWPFNGNANDESGNGNNGTVNGALLTSDRNGKVNSAYNFNGATNSILLQAGSNIQGNNPRSISFWFKPTSSTPYTNIIYKGGSNGNGNDFSVMYRVDANNKYQLLLRRYTDDVHTDSIPLTLNQWSNYSVVYDGSINSNLKIYINGIEHLGRDLPGTGQTFNTESVSAEFGHLKDQLNVDYYLTGNLDDIAIYNRALSQQDITALYSGTPTTGLASTKVFVDAPATVKQNDTLELSISTEALNSSDNVIAFQTDFAYDSTKYTYVNNHVVGTLNANGTVVVNSSKKGKLSISYMAQIALNGAGSLVKLKFKANATLGQGIFSLANFMYNNTDMTALKSDTVNTIDGTPPRAKLSIYPSVLRKGDSVAIDVFYFEKMADSPVPQIYLYGQNTLNKTNLTKVSDTHYTFWWVTEKGNGKVKIRLATGTDLAGNLIDSLPVCCDEFTVLPTIFGDIDTNKFVRAFDAALALQYSVGLNPLPTMDPLPWSNWRIAVANVDTVGNVTANDASLILQHSAKVITSFPADAKKRGDAPVANITVTQEANQLVFRATGTLYAFNVFIKDNFNAFGQPEVKDKNAMIATNISATTYNVGLASTTPFTENEPFLILPIVTNENVQGTMDIVANAQEKALAYGAAATISTLQKEAMVIYPNPTKDMVTINNAQGKTLKIVDVQGKEVYNAVLPNAKTEISLKALGARGMYVLHILDANNLPVQTKQIVLE